MDVAVLIGFLQGWERDRSGEELYSRGGIPPS
jgi:hypothetical protein